MTLFNANVRSPEHSLSLYVYFRNIEDINIFQLLLHQNVVKFFGKVMRSNSTAIIMEHLPGGNLMDFVKNNDAAIGGFLRLRLCAEISSGLAFLHEKLLKKRFYGGLKAEKVLLTDDLHCKITAFSSSMVSFFTGKTYSTGQSQQYSESTSIYAAPEALLNPTGKPTPAFDIYSFSIVVYLVLKRELPVSNKSLQGVYLESVKNGRRPELSFIDDLSKYCSGNQFAAVKFLKVVMQQCWAQNPADRPSMENVRKDMLQKQAELDPQNEVLKEVATAVDKMTIIKPMQSNHSCESFDIFHRLNFQLMMPGK